MKAAFLRWAAAAAMTVQLPACNFTASVETLLSPPRLTAEQEQIYQALMKNTGSSVSLKYPKRGEHLSAFTVVDLDGDKMDEAIVFYETSLSDAAENPLRIALLTKKSGKWDLDGTSDLPAPGADVECVETAALGSNPRTNLIVSYSRVDGGGNTAVIYHCEGSRLIPSVSIPYSAMSLRDLNGDGETELAVVTAAKFPNPAALSVYSLNENGRYQEPTETLPESMTDAVRMVFGEMPRSDGAGTLPAIYVDGSAGATDVRTAVLIYSGGMLSTVYADSADHIPTLRPAGCQTMDIDSDGEPEIPVQTVFYGYTASTETAQGLPMTKWYVCRNGLLMQKCVSYYAVSEGYIFLMPRRWEELVTAVQEDEETVFYVLDRSAKSDDGTPVLKEPLLRLCTVNDPLEVNAMQSDGYLLLRQQNGSYYLGKRESGAPSGLALTDGELVTAMRFPS